MTPDDFDALGKYDAATAASRYQRLRDYQAILIAIARAHQGQRIIDERAIRAVTEEDRQAFQVLRSESGRGFYLYCPAARTRE